MNALSQCSYKLKTLDSEQYQGFGLEWLLLSVNAIAKLKY